MIRIALVEDHLMFRQAVKTCLNSIPGFEVVAEASCGAEFEKMYHPDKIDIVLLDMRLHGQHGRLTLKNILKKFPTAKIIIVSQYDEPGIIYAMMLEGAAGYLTKTEDLDEIEETIRTVRKYGFCYHKNMGAAARLEMEKLKKIQRPPSDEDIQFSDVELWVVIHACNGLSSLETAKIMGLSKRQVDAIKARLCAKTFSVNLLGVSTYLYRHHFLYPEQMKSNAGL